jgi:hypothetical protein
MLLYTQIYLITNSFGGLHKAEAKLVLFRDRVSNEKECPQKAPRYPFWESAQLISKQIQL